MRLHMYENTIMLGDISKMTAQLSGFFFKARTSGHQFAEGKTADAISLPAPHENEIRTQSATKWLVVNLFLF